MRASGWRAGRRSVAAAIVVLLFAAVLAVSGGSRAGAQVPLWPTIAPWPVCSSPEQSLCVEYAEWVDDAGVVTDVYVSTAAPTTPQVWTIASNGLIQFQVSSRDVAPPGQTQPGIPEGTYRTSIRTGSLDPTLSIVTGHVLDHSVTFDEGSGWRLTMSVTPTQLAWGPDSCPDVQWMCHADYMAENAILVGISRFVDESRRADYIGMYFSSNSQSQMTPSLNPVARTITFGGAAPHWLPAWYGSGNEINPGFFDAFIPRLMLENTFGISIDTVTAESFIQESSIPLAPYAMTVTPTGILFRLGVTHWSVNDPAIKFRAWPSIDLEVTGARFAAHMGPGPGMSALPTGDVVFAACHDVACTSIDESTAVVGSLDPNASTATARVSRSSLPAGAPNYRAYYVGDANYPEGARAFSGTDLVVPNFTG